MSTDGIFAPNFKCREFTNIVLIDLTRLINEINGLIDVVRCLQVSERANI